MTDEDERDPLDQLDGPEDGGEPNASPKAYRQRVSKIEQVEQEREAFWRSVMADPIGRRAIWEFLTLDCHFEETRFAVGPNGFPQSESTWFEAGRQEVGQRLAKSLQKRCREGYLAMLDENDPAFAKPRKRGVKNG
jgi:hypothetical protein